MKAKKRRKCILCGRTKTEEKIGFFCRDGSTACYDIEDCKKHHNDRFKK